ncbi:TPR repeat protein [Cryptosporidium ryanae]|uniref:TPR repeat protein n=1 Tax=Cryptosporidium ryanae TaxID=515981 RepID=UPI003519F5BC|nr:TPR repeat protein [Cryptosporidium ryanae]
MNASELVHNAQELLNKFPPDYEEANKLFERAYKLEPKNSFVLSAYGEFMITIGNLENGKILIEESINVDPSDDYIKYFNLGQILEGEESLSIWKKGIDILANKLRTMETNNNFKNSSNEQICFLKDQLCSAFCAVTELYMTDLCDEEGAEAEIQRYLDKSEKINEDHFETLCCKLSYLKTIDNIHESKKYVSRIKELLYNKYDLNSDDLIDDDSLSRFPEYSVRLNLSRTLIDLNETELAEEILHSLLVEDDEDWQVWYLLSWCSLVTNNIENSIESFNLFEKYGEKHIIDPELKKQFKLDLENLRQNIEKVSEFEKK